MFVPSKKSAAIWVKMTFSSRRKRGYTVYRDNFSFKFSNYDAIFKLIFGLNFQDKLRLNFLTSVINVDC